MNNLLTAIFSALSAILIGFILSVYIWTGISPLTIFTAKGVKTENEISVVINKNFKLVYDKTSDINYAKWRLYRNNKCLPIDTYVSSRQSKFWLIMYTMNAYLYEYNESYYLPE